MADHSPLTTASPRAGAPRQLFKLAVAKELIHEWLARGVNACDPVEPMVGARIVGARGDNLDHEPIELLVYLPRSDGGSSWDNAPYWTPAFVRRAEVPLSEDKPRRAFDITLRVGGDTWDDALAELKRFAAHVAEHGQQCDLVSGGVSTGGYVHVVHNPDMTHEKYVAALEAITHG